MLIQKIERVNSMTIRKMANEELSQCVDVIRKAMKRRLSHSALQK